MKVLIPRLMLAGFLGVTVSKPLKLKIFETNIKEEIIKQDKANLDSLVDADLRSSINGVD